MARNWFVRVEYSVVGIGWEVEIAGPMTEIEAREKASAMASSDPFIMATAVEGTNPSPQEWHAKILRSLHDPRSVEQVFPKLAA